MRLLLRPFLGLYCLFVAAAASAASLPDGTLLCLENCNSVVEYTTRGEVAHVGLIFHDVGETWVYEATPGKVRRTEFNDYLVELARMNKGRNDESKIRALALKPRPEYAPDEVARMRGFLDEQIGRRYSVKNYVRGRPYDGIHCAELASSTLNASGRYAFVDCHKIHPHALYTAALATHAAAEQIAIPPLATAEPWIIRVQRRWVAMFAWCRWSSREAWLFLW